MLSTAMSDIIHYVDKLIENDILCNQTSSNPHSPHFLDALSYIDRYFFDSPNVMIEITNIYPRLLNVRLSQHSELGTTPNGPLWPLKHGVQILLDVGFCCYNLVTVRMTWLPLAFVSYLSSESLFVKMLVSCYLSIILSLSKCQKAHNNICSAIKNKVIFVAEVSNYFFNFVDFKVIH